ncbi:MAG: hypothetical protein ABIL46_06110 [candidate division WOR-3 bacterium]
MDKNSKIWVFVILSILYYSSCVYSIKIPSQYERLDLVVVSGYVGESFDFTEARKYNLFPKVKDFVEARLYKIEPGYFELEVITKSAKYNAVYGEEQLPAILKDYIENYNEISKSDTNFKKRWNIMAFDDQRLPITINEVEKIAKDHIFYSNPCLMGTTGAFVGAMIGGCIAGAYYYTPSCYGPTREFNYSAVLIGAAIVGSIETLRSLTTGKAEDFREAIKAINNSRRLEKVKS